MASNTAMFTGLSGLHASSRDLEVIGNNIANVNTTAFKSSRVLFSDFFYRTLSLGLEPRGDMGGTNPYQVGLGVQAAGTQQNFSLGAINDTGRPSDLAIDGSGFFIVRRDQDQLFTRAGVFDLDRQSFLVDPDGDRVQGFGVDQNFQITPGVLTDLSVPIGQLSIAEATTLAGFAGNLDASGDLPTTGSSIRLGGTPTAGLGLIAGASVPPGPGNVLETTSLLTEIEDPTLPGSGTALFAPGQIIELNGAQKGTRSLPIARFTIAAASTVQSLMDFMRDALGVSTATGPNPNGAMPGLGLNAAAGEITITGNTGTVNDLVVDADDIRLLDAAGTPIRSPFASTKLTAADGESVRTQFVAFDSLGGPVPVDVSLVLETRGTGGTGWRFYAESAADSDVSLGVGTGQLQFDTAGRLMTTAGFPISIDLAGTGAASPQLITLGFAGPTAGVTSLAAPSEVVSAADGVPFGVLTGFNADRDGVIVGSFDNGAQRMLGQVALGTFVNPEGLIDEGDNLFRTGPNSGPPTITTPGLGGSGPIIGGALEASNVDLGQEFIDMIMASTAYTASSRVIKTCDEMLEQLLTALR